MAAGRPGPTNLLTDVPGLRVGHAQDARLASGVSVVLFDEPAIASVAVLGGAPAGRDQECLEPERNVAGIDALVLSGGSGFGLDAATGVQAWLREQGRGFAVGSVRVPIVPTAILFDLLNGGDKGWGRFPPYRELGYAACLAAGRPDALGTVGAGTGATTVDLKGGIGAASAGTTTGATVAAMAAVNALGSALLGDGPHFWAASLEQNGEFGGLGLPVTIPPTIDRIVWKGRAERGTTIAIVATDARLTAAEAKRLAIMATAGFGRALRLAAAPLAGDTVLVAATGCRPAGADDLTELGARAADALARSIARGVHAASALPFTSSLSDWKTRFISIVYAEDFSSHLS